MDLTSGEGYYIKLCMKLTTVIRLDIYCSKIYHPSRKQVKYNNRLLPLPRQLFLVPSRINEVRDLNT
jgi:hypothetical protein